MTERLRYEVPFFQAPDSLVQDERTTVYHVGIFCVLAMHANKGQRAWPSIRRIAGIVRCSRPKVISVLRELESFGWISVKKRWNPERGCYDSTVYELQPSLQGGQPRLPGVVNDVYQGGQPRLPEPDPMNQTDIEPEKRGSTGEEEEKIDQVFDAWKSEH